MTTTTPAPTTSTAPALPSVHARAVITWLAIFPLVAIGMTAMAPFTADWHPVLRAFVLTLVVVPVAVYVVVPRLLGVYLRTRAPHRPLGRGLSDRAVRARARAADTPPARRRRTSCPSAPAPGR